MPKAVLTTKVDPSYDDLPEERYHFPRTYLNAARAALGDWIVYYEPRRSSAHLSSSGGRQSYFATARIVHVDGDPRKADHYTRTSRTIWNSTVRFPSARTASSTRADCRKQTGRRTRASSGGPSGSWRMPSTA